MKKLPDDPVMQAVLYPLMSGMAQLPADGPILLCHAVLTADLPTVVTQTRGTAWQWWKGPADQLGAAGYAVSMAEPERDDYAAALVRIPRQREEALSVLSRCWAALRPGGVLIAAAANDAGGKRLEGDLAMLPGLQATVKHKCRIVWAVKDAMPLPADWAAKGDWVIHPKTSLWTRPGLFSWDRIDTATAMLMNHIDPAMAGRVADPGCGIGVLADYVLKTCPKVSAMSCIDADARAIEACQRSLGARYPAMALEYHWADLSQPFAHKPVDHVVMNPPFHAEKKTTLELGYSFIINASQMLKKGGTLTMVANAHLPYEECLAAKFKSFTRLEQRNGFKIFRAWR